VFYTGKDIIEESDEVTLHVRICVGSPRLGNGVLYHDCVIE